LSGAILLVACVLLSAAASIFLKAGASALTEPLSLSALFNAKMIWIGAIFYSAAFIGYVYVLRLIPLSLAQPVITAGVSAVTALVAVMYFRESMAFANWIGLALVCVGIFFLFWGRT
jgi:multidrug transporter EmrE-like cation transporter